MSITKRNFIILTIAYFCSFSSFADSLDSKCAQAASTNAKNFCSTFKDVAKCHCMESGLPEGKCNDMDELYNRMISIFGTLQKACEYQHDTQTQTCIDDWNCYRLGGKDSLKRDCSSTGKSCR